MEALPDVSPGLTRAAPAAEPAWKLCWLTPVRCRIIFVAVVALGFVGHLYYLRNNCPIDLSGDEAQYWDWSRALDWSYYSKGPLVAYIIRASTELTGSNQMWAVRLPALVFAVATSVLTYWLTRKLFGSERLALGAVLLTHLVPMCVAGSILMTIDPPYFFFWGLATAFLAVAVLDERRWAWFGVGIAVGLGALAKYGTLLWPLGMLGFLLVDPRSRWWLRTPWPWAAVMIALLFLTPPIVWNVRHDWVTFKHVAKQTGASAQERAFDGNFLEFTASQLAVLGPPVAVILAGAVVFAFGRQAVLRREPSPRPSPGVPGEGVRGIEDGSAGASPSRAPGEGVRASDRGVVLLLWTGLPLFVICLLGSIRSKMQVNWPAAAYFPWLILAAHFLATRMGDRATWRRWRGWFWAAVVFGVAMIPLAHNLEHIYPIVPLINSMKAKKPIEPRDIDPSVAKMKGWKQLGERLTREMKGLNQPFILCDDYMQTAETAFYVEGNPKTFCAGPYISNVKDRKRRTQYDLWPDRDLSQPSLHGRDALYVGYISEDVRKSFKSIEQLPEEAVYRAGYKVRRFLIHRCRDFQGMTIQDPGGAY